MRTAAKRQLEIRRINRPTQKFYKNAVYIPLIHGKLAVIDAEDYFRVSQYNWRCRMDGNTYYAYTFRYVKGRKKLLFMHRFIMRAPKHKLVDHIDGNGLNNRKANLRLCNYNQNAWNRRPYFGCYSNYKGVYWNKEKKKWHAAIIKSYKRTHLGYFDNEIEAARAYDKKAKELFGEFAYLNFKNTDKHGLTQIYPVR